jgi:hypothetical protein
MRRTTEETNVCVAIIAGVGHEIDDLRKGGPMNETIMDLYNNSVGQIAGVTGSEIDPADLATLSDVNSLQSRAQSVLEEVVSAVLAPFVY